MPKVFAEMGIGNESFFSTEIEEGEREYRVPRFVWPEKIAGVYVRIWLGQHVFILSSKEGFVLQKKNRNNFKALLGVSGEGLRNLA
jgi:hypothetical protein